MAERFGQQAGTTVQRSSPLYESLLRHCTRDIREQGPTWQLVQDRTAEPSGDVLPLRLMAAVHRLVLAGEAPDLARCYPSAGGRRRPSEAWPAFRSLLEDRADDLRRLLDRPLQTNEVRRCTPLLVGLAWLGDRTGLPPTVLEIGASGGLNLNWHRFRYEGPDGQWGPADSPVRLPLPAGSTPQPVPAGGEPRVRPGPARRTRHRRPALAALVRVGGPDGPARPARRGARGRGGAPTGRRRLGRRALAGDRLAEPRPGR